MNNDIVMINLDRPRQLRFTHTALKTLEQLTGKKIPEIDEQMDLFDNELREKTIYCGLLKDSKDRNEVLNIDQIPELLDEAPNIAHVMEMTVRAWRSAFGQPSTPTEGNAPAPVETPAAEKTTASMIGTKVSE